jgi:hypothetical protein
VTSEAERHEGDLGHGGTLPTVEALTADARRLLDAAWRPDAAGGYCVPNASTYPWQWLWDSCFHAVVWAHLGDERGVLELRTALSAQDADGFVPHLRYGAGPFPHSSLWGRPDTSSITQPPMYGHAAALLARLGFDVGDEVLDRAGRGLRFLLERRRRSAGGLVELCHPWESGCDDSPRWDGAVPGGWTADAWYRAKGDWVQAIERSASGAPLHNPDFAVGSVGFNALIAWNASELGLVTGDAHLVGLASDLSGAIDGRWDADRATWVDDGPTAPTSGRVRTLDGLLPLLLHPRPEALASLVDPDAHGAECGPRGVHAAEPSYEPTTYWRGPAWPQLTYLLWLAATSSGSEIGTDAGSALERSMCTGAVRSGYAEYWVADTGAPLGAVPQTWSSLALAVRAGR